MVKNWCLRFYMSENSASLLRAKRAAIPDMKVAEKRNSYFIKMPHNFQRLFEDYKENYLDLGAVQ